MFDFVHKNKRILQLVLALMIIPFAFFGLESYTRSMRGSSDDVASVDGLSISNREFSEEFGQQLERIRSLLGRGADVSSFDTPDARKGLLDSLIDRRVLAESAVRANLAIGDEQLRDLIASMPPFQEDGRFSKSKYESLLLAQNLTPPAFEARMRHDLTMSQLERAVSGSAIESRAVAERLIALDGEKREIQEAVVKVDPYLAQVKVDEAQMKAYYDAHPAEFRTPEMIRADYVVLSAEELGAQAQASDDELKAAYTARMREFVQPEQRHISHILISVAPDAKPADKAAARKKAEEVLAEIRKTPSRFAELAKKYSQDPGSAEKGGDLGVVAPGAMVKPFEDAAFKLKDGETSGVIETEYGYHIIRITGIQPGKTKTLDEVRPELAKDIARQKGATKFAEAAEAFSNLAYEQSDSLKPLAERFKLPILHSEWIDRKAGPTAGLLANPHVLGALFSSDALQNKRNTDAVEVSPNVMVSARVTEHRVAAQQKFEDVKSSIETRLQREAALKLARKEGAERLAQLKAGKDAGVKWSEAREIARTGAKDVPADALRGILSADAAKLPAYVGADLDDGYGIFRVNKMIAAPAKTEAERKAALAQLEGQTGSGQFSAYVASLRSRAKIVVNEANLEKKAQP